MASAPIHEVTCHGPCEGVEGDCAQVQPHRQREPFTWYCTPLHGPSRGTVHRFTGHARRLSRPRTAAVTCVAYCYCYGSRSIRSGTDTRAPRVHRRRSARRRACEKRSAACRRSCAHLRREPPFYVPSYRYITVTLTLHYRYIAVTLSLHCRYIAGTRILGASCRQADYRSEQPASLRCGQQSQRQLHRRRRRLPAALLILPIDHALPPRPLPPTFDAAAAHDQARATIATRARPPFRPPAPSPTPPTRPHARQLTHPLASVCPQDLLEH